MAMGVVYRIPAYTDTLLPILPKTIMYRTNEKLKQCISTPIQLWGGKVHHSYIIQTVRYKS